MFFILFSSTFPEAILWRQLKYKFPKHIVAKEFDSRSPKYLDMDDHCCCKPSHCQMAPKQYLRAKSFQNRIWKMIVHNNVGLRSDAKTGSGDRVSGWHVCVCPVGRGQPSGVAVIGALTPTLRSACGRSGQLARGAQLVSASRFSLLPCALSSVHFFFSN